MDKKNGCEVMTGKKRLCRGKPVARIKLPWSEVFWVCAEHLRDFQRDYQFAIEYKEV